MGPQHSWWAPDQRRPASVGTMSASRLMVERDWVPTQWPGSVTALLPDESSASAGHSPFLQRTRGDQTKHCQKLGLTVPSHSHIAPLYDAVASRGNLRTSPCVQQLDATAGRGSVHLDQPHASGFLYYHRTHGTPYRYVGSREQRFTNHVYRGYDTRSDDSAHDSARLSDIRRVLRHQKYDLASSA